jgi:hypothetical protein
MIDFWKWYLALCLTIAAMVAAFAERIATPVEPADVGYPIIATQSADPLPTWIDGCGVFHYGPLPEPWPTAVPPGGCAYP